MIQCDCLVIGGREHGWCDLADGEAGYHAPHTLTSLYHIRHTSKYHVDV